jgi:peptide/nickel transport system permease protein
VLCLWVILFLATTSIFAPFLANEKPLAYRGFNRFEYAESVRTVRTLLGQLVEESAAPEDDQSQSAAGSAPQAAIVRAQLERMARQLVPEDDIRVRQFADEVSAAARSGDTGALSKLRTQVRRDFDPRNAKLRSRWHSPVLAGLAYVDIVFMAFNVVLVSSPVWRRLLRRRLGRHHPALANLTLGAHVLVPLLAGALWWSLVPERMDRTKYKQGVLSDQTAADASRAPVVFEQVVWAPVPFGLDEDNLDAKLLPPEFWSQPDSASPRSEARVASPNGLPSPVPHWMGTDGIGRDILCRMIWGGRVSLAVGIVAVAIYVAIGIFVGAVAGYFRGWVDMIVSRIIEVVICFPSFFLILTIVAFIGPSIFNIMVVIGLIGWTGVARLVRGEFLRLGEQDFVAAARALGYSSGRIIFRHVLPNSLAPVLVSATFGIAGAILTESALSFLGFGITVPKPSWGGILADGRTAIFSAPWLIYFPGLAIFITITCYNLVGEAFRDASDPRLRQGGRA